MYEPWFCELQYVYRNVPGFSICFYFFIRTMKSLLACLVSQLVREFVSKFADCMLWVENKSNISFCSRWTISMSKFYRGSSNSSNSIVLLYFGCFRSWIQNMVNTENLLPFGTHFHTIRGPLVQKIGQNYLKVKILKFGLDSHLRDIPCPLHHNLKQTNRKQFSGP